MKTTGQRLSNCGRYVAPVLELLSATLVPAASGRVGQHTTSRPDEKALMEENNALRARMLPVRIP